MLIYNDIEEVRRCTGIWEVGTAFAGLRELSLFQQALIRDPFAPPLPRDFAEPLTPLLAKSHGFLGEGAEVQPRYFCPVGSSGRIASDPRSPLA